jgi:hypothetical protein
LVFADLKSEKRNILLLPILKARQVFNSISRGDDVDTVVVRVDSGGGASLT